MARNSVPIGSFCRLMPRAAWLRAATAMAVLAIVSGFGPSLISPCEAAGIAAFLTPKDRSKAIDISETGLPISPGSSSTSGNMPAYAAFPLSGGEHLPAGLPTVTTASQAGVTVGPLDLTPMVQANLNADLDGAKAAIVQTPTQSYAVEYLPRYGLAQIRAARSATTAEAGQGNSSSSTSSTSSNPLSALASSLSIAGIPASDLSKWTSSGLADLEKALHLGGSKATAKKPSTNVEAQYLAPPLAESSAGPSPIPAPEPSTWLIFGVLLGAVGVRKWTRIDSKSHI